MKAIKVHIEKLGRVCNTDLDITPVMIFSGESGFGKSYLAILCHFFFHVFLSRKSFHKFYLNQGCDFTTMSKEFEKNGEAYILHKADIEKWIASEALLYVRYMLGNDTLEGNINVSLPDVVPSEMPISYRKGVSGFEGAEQEDVILSMGDLSYRIPENDDFDESPFAFLTRFVIINYIWEDWRALKFDFVMPPSRGPLLSERINAVSGLFQEYVRGLDELIKATMRDSDESHVVLDKLHQILDGEVTREESAFYYKTVDATIPISAAAASVRELAPIQFLVQKTDVSKAFVLVEEPEAHLHPLKQRMMADILCCLAKSGTFLQITTHSDYFLHRMNEIIRFSKAKETISDNNAVEELSDKLNIQEDFCIDVKNINAYIMLKREDGTTFAKQQNLEEGIPYNTFKDALKMNVMNNVILENIMNHVD